MGSSAIAYCTKTWNPTTGCPFPLTSKGCLYCWARLLHDMRHKAFLAGKKMAPQYAHPFSEIHETGRWAEPLRWRKPQVVFVGSQTDLFHEAVSDSLVGCTFAVMALCERHTYLVLTKRPKRMDSWIYSLEDETHIPQGDLHGAWGMHYPGPDVIEDGSRESEEEEAFAQRILDADWPLQNVYLGATACTQAEVDAALPVLARLAAAGWRTWLSLEPLLEAVDLRQHERWAKNPPGVPEPPVGWLPEWVVVGCESGPRRRPCPQEWVRSVLGQCRAAGVECYIKQIPRGDGAKVLTRVEDFPADLRVRETPWFERG